MKEQKHHYLPIFYLKNWLDQQSFLHGYHYAKNGKLINSRWHPRNTGCTLNLYSRTNKDGSLNHDIEKNHFVLVDNNAAIVLQKLIKNNSNLSQVDREIWAKFLISLLVRQPQNINDAIACKEKALKDIPLDDQTLSSEDYIEFVNNAHIDMIAASCGYKNQHSVPFYNELLDNILGTHWLILDFSHIKYELLTSDRPIRSCDLINLDMPSKFPSNVIKDYFTRKNMFMAFPLSPKKCFILSHEYNRQDFSKKELKLIIRYLNLLSIKSARQFVLSNNHNQNIWNYVQTHFDVVK